MNGLEGVTGATVIAMRTKPWGKKARPIAKITSAALRN
jgi:hypothetical protein